MEYEEVAAKAWVIRVGYTDLQLRALWVWFLLHFFKCPMELWDFPSSTGAVESSWLWSASGIQGSSWRSVSVMQRANDFCEVSVLWEMSGSNSFTLGLASVLIPCAWSSKGSTGVIVGLLAPCLAGGVMFVLLGFHANDYSFAAKPLWDVLCCKVMHIPQSFPSETSLVRQKW